MGGGRGSGALTNESRLRHLNLGVPPFSAGVLVCILAVWVLVCRQCPGLSLFPDFSRTFEGMGGDLSAYER
jgi:hypothetical protein